MGHWVDIHGSTYAFVAVLLGRPVDMLIPWVVYVVLYGQPVGHVNLTIMI